MSNECGFKFQVSVKFGEYDNAMLNIRADTESELDNALQAAIRQSGNLAVMAEAVRATAMGGGGVAAAPVAALSNAGAPPAPAQAARPAPTAAPAASGHVCAHGPRVRRSGPDWEGWFCPLPKDDPNRCKPLYPGR